MDPKTIRARQAADELGLSSQSVRNLIRSGKLRGQKDVDGQWMVDRLSVARYLALRGRHKPAESAVGRLQRQVEELTQSVEALRADSPGRRPARTVELERDRYRTQAVATRQVALSALASADATEEAMSKLQEALREQRNALRQLLVPGGLDDELTPIEVEG